MSLCGCGCVLRGVSCFNRSLTATAACNNSRFLVLLLSTGSLEQSRRVLMARYNRKPTTSLQLTSTHSVTWPDPIGLDLYSRWDNHNAAIWYSLVSSEQEEQPNPRVEFQLGTIICKSSEHQASTVVWTTFTYCCTTGSPLKKDPLAL